jgi:hypothetical protein
VVLFYGIEMSTTSQPVTQTNSLIPTFERWMDWLVEGLSQAERAARKRWKKQVSKQFTRCQSKGCCEPLVSKRTLRGTLRLTLRGTDDIEKAICSDCKVVRKDAAKVAKRAALIQKRNERYRYLNRDRYINKLDARYVGPDARRTPAKPVGKEKVSRMGGNGIHTPVGSLATAPRSVEHVVDVNDRKRPDSTGPRIFGTEHHVKTNWCPGCKEYVAWNHEHQEQLA